MRYRALLSARAVKDLDRLDNDIRERILNRIEELAEAPRDPRISAKLTHKGDLHKSRVGGWRPTVMTFSSCLPSSIVNMTQ